MDAPLPILGNAYEHYSQDLSSQTLKNWYVEVNRDTSKPVSLQPFPGQSVFSSGTSVDGGLYTWKGVTYKIDGTTLYSVDSAGTRTSIGTIAGVGVCSFAAIDGEMAIVRDGNVYTYDGTTLTTESDADFESPEFVDLINQQALYDGNNNRFCISDAADLGSINGLNFATAETQPGTLQRVFVFKEIIYVCTDTYIVQWWNDGSGNPPVEKITGTVMDIGVKEPRSMAKNQNFMYFLGDDSVVYRISSSEPQKVSTIPLSTAFKGYDTTGAVGLCFPLRGQEFYSIYFPQQQKTWLFSESGGWSELTYKDTEVGLPITSYTENYSKQLFSIDGDIVALDDSLFRSGTDVMYKERISDKIDAGIFGQQYLGKEVEHNRLTITAEIVGLLDDAPHIILGISDDGGRNFSDITIQGGQLGQYVWLFEAYDLGSAIDRRYRIRVTDNVKCSIQGGSMEVNLGV